MSNSEKKIPKSLKECYATDNVSSNLWSWSARLEDWGEKILLVLIAVGVISTIAEAIQIAKIGEGLVFITVVTSAITWFLYAFLEYCAYHVLSLLIASLATIVQNSRITANVALYNTAKEEGALEEEPKAIKKPGSSSPKIVNSGGSWICKECGTKNDAGTLSCKDCGKYK